MQWNCNRNIESPLRRHTEAVKALRAGRTAELRVKIFSFIMRRFSRFNSLLSFVLRHSLFVVRLLSPRQLKLPILWKELLGHSTRPFPFPTDPEKAQPGTRLSSKIERPGPRRSIVRAECLTGQGGSHLHGHPHNFL